MEDIQDFAQDEPPIGSIHDGYALRRILEQRKVSIQDFADHYLQKSKAVAYAFLRKAVFTREELAMVCYLLNCSAVDFQYPPDYLLTETNKSQILKENNNVAAFHSLAQYEQDHAGKDFIKLYFQDLSKYTCEANENLRIFHYLSKNKNHYRPNVLEEVHVYYEAIERRLALQKDLKYARFFALPISLSDIQDDLSDTDQSTLETLSNGPSEDFVLQKAIELMLPETIRHIIHCLYHFGQRFSAFSIHIPPRLNSFTIVDDRYVISEYDRINRNRKVSHDIMFVDRILSVDAEDPIAMLLKVYNRDLDNLIFNSDAQQRSSLQLEKIAGIIVRQSADLDSKINNKEKDIQTLNSGNQGILFSEKDLGKLLKVSELKSEMAQLKEQKKDWDEKWTMVQQATSSIMES